MVARGSSLRGAQRRSNPENKGALRSPGLLRHSPSGGRASFDALWLAMTIAVRHKWILLKKRREAAARLWLLGPYCRGFPTPAVLAVCSAIMSSSLVGITKTIVCESLA